MTDEASWGRMLFPPGHVATGRLAPAVLPQPQYVQAAAPPNWETVTEPEPLPPFNADPTAGPPKTTAQLIIRALRRNGEEYFTVQGLAAGCDLSHYTDHRYGRPQLVLATLVSKSGYRPVQTYYALQEWAWEKNVLHRWLNELRVQYGDELDLVVWDDTDYEIPWELFWLPEVPAAGLPGGWLGAAMSVTRNTTVVAPSKWAATPTTRENGTLLAATPPSARAQPACGEHRPVVAFVSDEMSDDKAVITSLRPQYFDSFRKLLTVFESPRPRIALAYVACHGQFGVNEFEIHLDGFSLLELTSVTRDRLTSAPEVVFLNACHTARPMLKGMLGDANPRSFSQMFLRAGSFGVIGTTGEVGRDNGRGIAEAIISRLTKSPDVPITTVLRDHRRALAKQLPHRPASDLSSQQAVLRLFYAFMYVYYGDPATCLRLGTGRDVAP